LVSVVLEVINFYLVSLNLREERDSPVFIKKGNSC